jgi:hypothetical protein
MISLAFVGLQVWAIQIYLLRVSVIYGEPFGCKLTLHKGLYLRPRPPQDWGSEGRGLARRLGPRRFAGYEA